MKKSNSITFTLEQLRTKPCASLNPDLFQEQEKIAKKRTKVSKYRNKKTEVDGIVFDSVKEAVYYKKLLLLRKAGEIGLIERQVKYELNIGGTYSLKYISDFEYFDKLGIKHVIDVKGFKTREYKKKKKLMLIVHGISIEEI